MDTVGVDQMSLALACEFGRSFCPSSLPAVSLICLASQKGLVLDSWMEKQLTNQNSERQS